MKDFNFFLPYIESKKMKRSLFYSIIVSVSLISILIIFYVANVFRILTLNKRINSINAQINSPEIVKQTKRLEEAQKKHDLMKKYYDIVDNANGGLLSSNTVTTELISDLASTLPLNVNFSNMSIASNEINIQGTASTRIEIAELEHNIKALNDIDNVSISVISVGAKEGSAASNGSYMFSLKCSVKGVSNNENK